MSQRAHKFGAKTVITLEGERFDSTGAFHYFQQLKLLEKAGKIERVERQIPYVLTVNGMMVAKIVVDFKVTIPGKGIHVGEFKGMITPVARLKIKMFKAQYQIPFHLIRLGEPDTLLAEIPR